MTTNIARLGVLLGLDSAEFVRGLDAANRKLWDFADKAAKAGPAVVAGFAAMATAAIHYADELADVAKANDIAIDSVVKLGNALANAGGKSDDAGKLLSAFTNSVDKAAQGSSDVQDAFARVGVSLKDLRQLSTEDLFDKALKGISQIEDPLQRNAKAMDLFGKAAKGVDIPGLVADMESANSITKQQAQAVQDAADSYDRLKQEIRNVSLQIAVELGPMLKNTLDYLKDLTGESNLFGTAFRTVFQTVAVLGSDLLFVLRGMASEIGNIIDVAKALGSDGIAAAAAVNAAHNKRWEEERKKLDDFQARVMGTDKPANYMGKGFDDPRTVKGTPSDRRTVKPADLKDAQKHAAEVAKAELDARYAVLMEGADSETKLLLELNKRQDEILNEQEKNNIKEQNKFKEENQRIANAKLVQAAIDFRTKMKELADKQSDYVLSQQEQGRLQEEEDQRQGAIILENYAKQNQAVKEKQALDAQALERAQERFRLENNGAVLRASDLQYAKDIQDIEWKRQDNIKAIQADERLTATAKEEAMQREEAAAQRAIALAKERNQIEAELRNRSAGTGWSVRIGEFIRDLPTDFQLAQNAFDTLVGGMDQALDSFVRNGKKSFKDFAKSVIQDITAMYLKASANRLLGMMLQSFAPSFGAPTIGESWAGPKAEGGPVSANSTYLVGERGPEIFVPSGSGTIIPNHAMAGMGSTTNVTNNYINAIDTKSFEDRILGSSKAVWAANQYGSKNIAVGRGRT